MTKDNQCQCGADLTPDNRAPGRMRCRSCHAAYHRRYRGSVRARQAERAERAMRDGVILRCRACHERKPCTEFNLSPCTASGFSTRCLQCTTKYMESYAKRPGIVAAERARHLRRMYGLTDAEFQAMLEKSPVCEICGAGFVASRREPFIDHNHASGGVRGLLCLRCNSVLGYSLDSPGTLRSAAAYLEKYREGVVGGRVTLVVSPLAGSIPQAPVAGPDG